MRNRLTSIVILLTFLFGIIVSNLVLSNKVFADVQPLVYDLNQPDSLEGWGEAWQGSLSGSGIGKIKVAEGNYALSLQVKFDETNGWDKRDIGKWLSGQEGSDVDLSNYCKVYLDVYFDKAKFESMSGQIGIKIAVNSWNNGWAEIGAQYGIDKNTIGLEDVNVSEAVYRKLSLGFDIPDEAKSKPRGQLVIEIAGQNSTYDGLILIDNVRIECISQNSEQGASQNPEQEQTVISKEDVVFDFEDPEKGTMGWQNGWGSALEGQPQPQRTEDLKISGNSGSLKIFPNYKIGTDWTWEEAAVQVWIYGQQDTKFDLTGYKYVEYDVYIPDPTQWLGGGKITIGSAFNSDWFEIKTVGYMIEDIKSYPIVTINGKRYTVIHRSDAFNGNNLGRNHGQLVIRIACQNAIYKGPIYLDNISIRQNPTAYVPPTSEGYDNPASQTSCSTSNTSSSTIIYWQWVAPTVTQQSNQENDTNIVFDFSKQDDLMGFKEPWSGALKSAKNLRWSNDISENGLDGAIKLDAAFDPNNGWHDFNVGKWLGPTEGSPVDLKNFEQLEFDVIVDKLLFEKSAGGIAIKAALNGDPGGWADIDEEFNITKDTTSSSKVVLSSFKIKDKEYTKIHVMFKLKESLKTNTRGQLVIQIAGQNSNYTGPIYIDNVILVVPGGKISASTQQNETQQASDQKTATEQKSTVSSSQPVSVNKNDKVFDFSNKNDLMGFKEPWSGALKAAKSIGWSSDVSTDGKNGALKLDVKFDPNNGWHDTNIGVWLGTKEGEVFDFSPYKAVQFEMYLPKALFEKASGSLAVKVALNGEPGGWADVGEVFGIDKNKQNDDVVTLTTVKVGANEYVKVLVNFTIKQELRNNKRGQIILQIAGQNSNYEGPIYIDNFKLISDSKPNTQDTGIPQPKTPVEFKDISKHWAKNEILFVSSLSNVFRTTEMFEPDKKIRRSEMIDWLVNCLGINGSISDVRFNDVSKLSKYYNSIAIAYNKGLIKGDGKGNIKPNDAMTREQVIVVLIRTIELLKGKININENKIAQFQDANLVSEWAKESFEKALQIGLISGYSDNTIRPQNACSRAEAAALIYRVYNYILQK